MSADDMLAAQLWPWPDPIIKRNAQGGIIFVNAAFLQLYGGQVTDWHGCAVDGWPAPSLEQAPSRFETRMPNASNELVFDWLEYIMADGGALAISRNVTALLNSAPPPEPTYHAEPYEAAHNPAAAHGQPPINAPMASTEAYTPDPNMAAPNMAEQADAYHAPVETHNPAPVDNYVDNYHEPAPQNDTGYQEPEPVYAAPAAAQPEPQERDFERRALPIEDDESLLGTNWRDAVIAKAVGADEMAAAVAPEVVSPVEIEVPMEDMPAIAAPETSSLTAKPKADDNMIRILLAEDNAINALLTRTLLEADGCFVEVVEDGRLAVEAVKANQYDMILMDMRMPNMDGLESTRKIRTLSNEAKAIPIIALTANAFDDDRNACFDAGMNDFMTKPVSAEELQQMVRTWTSTAKAEAA